MDDLPGWSIEETESANFGDKRLPGYALDSTMSAFLQMTPSHG